MPVCTGNPSKTDMWHCPYCSPKAIADGCHTQYGTENGPVQVPCTNVSCIRVGFKSDDNGIYLQHLVLVHNWPNLPNENAEYAKLLTLPPSAPVIPEARLNRKDRRRVKK